MRVAGLQSNLEKIDLVGPKCQLIAKCLKMVIEKKVCPETTSSDWVRILLYAHSKGYLYTNKDASAFVLCYRIPEWREEYGNVMPEVETGEVLYVSFSVSESNDKLSLLRMLKSYSGIKQAVWHRRGDDNDLAIYNIRKK